MKEELSKEDIGAQAYNSNILVAERRPHLKTKKKENKNDWKADLLFSVTAAKHQQ